MVGESSVFISYATGTKPLAEELTRALERQGIEAWVDFKDLRPGQRAKDELETAANNAQSFLILVGPDNKVTPWQEAEWTAALTRTWADTDKRLIPVVFGESEPPPFLRNWVSLRVDPDKEPGTWTHHVLAALRSLRNEAIHGDSRKLSLERWRRLEEIGQAAEILRADEPAEPAVAPKASLG